MKSDTEISPSVYLVLDRFIACGGKIATDATANICA